MTPAQGSKYVLRKTFTSDDLAAKDGYTVGKWFYILEDERIPRKSERFLINVTTRTQQHGWVRIQVEIPVIYGEPWKELLKSQIKKELQSNYDLIGMVLSEVCQEIGRGFDLSWEEDHDD